MSGTQSNFKDERVEGENRWAMRDALRQAMSDKKEKDRTSFGQNRKIDKDASELIGKLDKDGLNPKKTYGKVGPEKKPLPLIGLSDELYDILDEIKSPIARSILELEKNPLVHNGLRIEVIDLSKSDWCFDVRIGEKTHNMKIGRFVRYFFNTEYTQKDVFKFSEEYNKLKGGTEKGESDNLSNFKLINSEDYKQIQDPTDIKSTFISLVTQTYPHGYEEEVMHLLPNDLLKDKFGNYYKIIGKSTTMFTSHLDTADRTQSTTVLYEMEKEGQTYITTDGTSILGADDKSGVAVMLNMIHHRVPGVYYFFIGEERGGIGSGKVANDFEEISHLHKIKKCVSFDRRNYHSVITSQLGKQCCSDEFATALSNELNNHGLDISLDPTGIYTDSANFIEDIPECTNISVGYFNEHTESEYQNITYLEKLAKASLLVDWENLPIVRKVGFAESIRAKYRMILNGLRRSVFNSDVKVVGEGEQAFIKINLEEASIDESLDDLLIISGLMKKSNIDPDIYFSEQYIKIELK